VSRRINATALGDLLVQVFCRIGFSGNGARTIATLLIEADLRGVHSHGVLLAPLYVKRVRSGLVDTRDEGEVVIDNPAVAVIDAHDAAGQLAGRQAMALAIGKARHVGIGAVAVRHSNHFGAAAAYVQQAIEAGCIGIAMSNTTPLMPAPGGAEAVVGNNPLAIGVPGPDGGQVVLDMALSAVAGGKIKYAAAAGRPIPRDWATDADGVPTTDPQRALEGLLLPFGGHKGFGLALIADLLAGGLSGGATGRNVRSIYRNLDEPNDCSHLFLALDPAAFGMAGAFTEAVGRVTDDVHSSRRAPGTDRLYVPGEIEEGTAAQSQVDGIELEDAVLDELHAAAVTAGLDARSVDGLLGRGPTVD
jgi:LDH2 family malate/lactate/ureidoglycolate dehydrogenase